MPGVAEVSELQRAFLDKTFPSSLQEYDRLWVIEDPEETPYLSKYKARKVLDDMRKEAEDLLKDDPSTDQAERLREIIARIFFFQGTNFYFCEETAVAESCFNKSLERYLKLPQRLDPKAFLYILDVLNHLGMVWCGRSGHQEGMNFLRRAQIMFINRPKAIRETCEVEAQGKHTLTVFYLAQAYGGLNKPHLSARFCAETMSRQLVHNTSGTRKPEELEKDPFNPKDWVRNCCSLADYFENEGMFWTAEYLLQSGAVLCEKCVELCDLEPDGLDELQAEVTRDLGVLFSTRLKYAKTCTEYPMDGRAKWQGERRKPEPKGNAELSQGSKLTFRTSADLPEDKEAEDQSSDSIAWDDIFPEVVHLEDEEALDNRLAEEEVVASESKAADGAPLLCVSDALQVRLPVHFARLHDVVQRRIQRANSTFLRLRSVAPPLPGWSLPGTSASDGNDDDNEGLVWPPAGLPSCAGTSFEAVREIFKLSMHYFRRSLAHFLLDGWVTEHVRILQEVSQLYRSICFWEQDPRRLAAMMTRRIQMLGPLLDQLNPKVYIAFWRQLSFECGEVSQELYDLKALGKVPGEPSAAADDLDAAEKCSISPARAAKANMMAKRSIRFYNIYIESYRTNDDKEPEQVEKGDANAYLTARLNRARLQTKMVGLSIEEKVKAHTAALREYEWLGNYKMRNPEVCTDPEINMAKEMALIEEMAALLPSKLDRLAAKRRAAGR